MANFMSTWGQTCKPDPIDKNECFLYFNYDLTRKNGKQWAVSSAVEYRFYKPGVTGSNPVPPTRYSQLMSREKKLFWLYQ